MINKHYHKYLGYMTLVLWLAVAAFEICTAIFVNPKPIYFRAWEYVSNYRGRDAAFAPFKPLAVYNGTMAGDLLNAIEFKPLPSETRHQLFQVDEFGYRNPVGQSLQPLDAVVIGSSFVGGAQMDQKDLVTAVLTNQYNIKAYNYNTSVQYVWEDWRFLKTPPKYVIFVGTEGEIISSIWQYSILDRPVYNNPKAWNSFKEWQAANEFFSWKFDRIAADLKDYSVLRHLINDTFVDIKNRLMTREQIAKYSLQDVVTYDLQTKMLFFRPDYDNPILNSSTKTVADIEKAITELKKTRDLLSSRGMTLVIAAMPSKAHAEMSKYQNLPEDQDSLVVLQQRMTEEKIQYIDLLTPAMQYVKGMGKHLYYPDDTHWTPEGNQMIAKILSEKIKSLDSN